MEGFRAVGLRIQRGVATHYSGVHGYRYIRLVSLLDYRSTWSVSTRCHCLYGIFRALRL